MALFITFGFGDKPDKVIMEVHNEDVGGVGVVFAELNSDKDYECGDCVTEEDVGDAIGGLWFASAKAMDNVIEKMALMRKNTWGEDGD